MNKVILRHQVALNVEQYNAVIAEAERVFGKDNVLLLPGSIEVMVIDSKADTVASIQREQLRVSEDSLDALRKAIADA